MPKSSVKLPQGPAQHKSHPFMLCICYSLSHYVCASFLLAQVPPCIFPADKRERLTALISKKPTDVLQTTTANRTTTKKNVYQACTHAVSANCCAWSHAAGCRHRPRQHRRHQGRSRPRSPREAWGKQTPPSPRPGGTKPSPRLHEAPWVPDRGIYSPRTRLRWGCPPVTSVTSHGASPARSRPRRSLTARPEGSQHPHGPETPPEAPALPLGSGTGLGAARGRAPPAGPGPEARGAADGAGPRGHHGNFQNVPPGPAATASRGQWAPSAWLTLLR